MALLVYFRVPRGVREDADDAPRLHQRIQNGLERLELWTYDWRARDLGRASTRSDEVVVVAIDDETLASARKDELAAVAVYPWPRQLIGEVMERLVNEGSPLVISDLRFLDLSPRTCALGCPQGPDPVADDLALRAALDRVQEQSLLTFSVEPSQPRVGSSPRPFLLQVARRDSAQEAQEVVRRILAARRPAFVIPDRNRVQVWAGLASESDADEVGHALGLATPYQVRELSPTERAYEVTPLSLLVSLAEVKVEGIDPSLLPLARALAHPVAPLLGDRSLYGVGDPSRDVDGAVRTYAHLYRYAPREGEVHLLPSAPLAAAMRLARTDSLRYAEGRLWVGEKYSLPVDPSGYSLIRWDSAESGRDARGTLKRDLSAWRVLVNARDRQRGLPQRFRNELEGRITVLADTSGYSRESLSTPVGQVPRAAVTGQVLANVLRSDAIRRAEPRLEAILVLAMAFLGALVALTFGASARTPLASAVYLGLLLGLAGAYLSLARSVFLEDRLWIPTVAPLIAMAATVFGTTTYARRTERRIREFITSLLGGSISPEVARQVSRDLSLMRPERRPATIAFCDIEGFTRLSEQLPPERLVQLLNDFLTEMTTVVRSHGGHVEYTGDTLMAFWGAPVRTDRHAHLGCESMLLMREALARKQRAWEDRYGQRIDFRAGINSGEVLAGDMGSELQSKYTVLGDAVLLASRLERANRELGTWILVGEGTAKTASDAYVFREVDRVRVRGKSLPWAVLELVGRKDEVPEEKLRLLPLHEQAMLAYHQRQFPEAGALFTRLQKEFNDPVAAVYVARCLRLGQFPPPAEWDGVFEQAAA